MSDCTVIILLRVSKFFTNHATAILDFKQGLGDSCLCEKRTHVPEHTVWAPSRSVNRIYRRCPLIAAQVRHVALHTFFCGT